MSGSWPTLKGGIRRTGVAEGEEVPETDVEEKLIHEVSGKVTAHPAAADDKLFFGTKSNTDSRLYAFDPDNREQLWSIPTEEKVHTTPTVTEDRLFFGSNDGNLYSVDKETGQIQWQFSHGEPIASSPTLHNGKIFFGIGGDNFNIYAVDQETGEQIWEFETGTSVISAASADDDTIFIASDNLYALNTETGKEEWQLEDPSNLTSNAVPTVGEDSVYYGSHEGLIYSLNKATGEIQWTFELDNATYHYSSPSIADGTVYVGADHGDDNLYALDASTGEPEWVFETRNWIRSNPVVADNAILFSNNNRVFSVDRVDGSEHWCTTLETYTTRITFSPIVVDGTVYAGTERGNIFALE